MSTKDYFMYYNNKADDLHCLYCGDDIQYVSITEMKDHYRCSNKKCDYHHAGTTVSKNEYPLNWVKRND